MPVYYEGRLAKLALDEAEHPKIDPDFEEATEGEEIERKEKLKTKLAQLEAVVGAEKRLKLVTQDIVEHFEKRLEAMVGKAMVVCTSRRICVAQVIEELITLAKEMREASARGEQLGLSKEELAFYDALETNDNAVKVLGDETLRTIARELVETVRCNVTID